MRNIVVKGSLIYASVMRLDIPRFNIALTRKANSYNLELDLAPNTVLFIDLRNAHHIEVV